MGIFSDVLLTVDFDRTLTARDSTIPERNLEAIRYFMENGGAFTVNTGRSLPMTRVFRDIVPVNVPLLLYNGSAAYDLETDTILDAALIPLDQAQTILRTMEQFPDMTVEIQGLDAHYIFEENPAWDAFSEGNHCAWAHARPEDDLGPFLKFALYGQLRSTNVSALYEYTPAEKARFDEVESLLRAEFGEFCEVFRAAPKILDIHAKGVSKANAARALQKKLGRKILVCVGDGENDLSMLRGADFAFAPSDAIVAKQFPNVCPCGEGAVADVIYKKIPEILKDNA
ncbi:MAG: HAD-IIB family hydrolase [Oscillospiraceae bacterium]|nr:HAD-IIB family hydrolase [Oscillospiraceae bacterium]